MEGQSSSSANPSCSFKKKLSESEVCRRNLCLQKKDVETIIKPHLTWEQIDTLNKAEGVVHVAAVDDKTGKRFKVSLSSAGYSYALTGMATMIKEMKLQAGDRIDVSWRDGALHIFLCLDLH